MMAVLWPVAVKVVVFTVILAVVGYWAEHLKKKYKMRKK